MQVDSARHAQSLSGVLVIELGQRVGASVCGALLAQLGAEVVFVEYAAADGHHHTKLTWRYSLAAGKRSLRLREGSADDLATVKQLVQRADVVLRSSDVDGSALRIPSVASDRVDCDVTAFGRGGSDAGVGWSDQLIQAVSGVLHTTGLPGEAPVAIDFPLVEFMTGSYAAAAVLAALRVRRRQGRSQAIDMALFDCAFHAMSTFLPPVLIGSGKAAGRVGNRHSMAAPWNVYRARDGWILICAASDVQWQRMCDVMDRPDLVTDPRFAALPDRVANSEDVDAAVQAWVGANTADECIARLGAASIACGPIAEIDGYPRERNIDYRRMALRLRDPESGADVFVAASPLRMSRTPGVAPCAIPAVDSGRAWVEAALQRPCASGNGGLVTDSLPLAGLRVIEIGHYTTAPLAARHLATLGAEVLKIEPPGGEAVRVWPPAKHGQGIFFTYTNAGKKSLVLDLANDEDADLLRRLVASADVLIENLKPGTLAKRGFTSEALLKLNPRLVYCAVSGFGVDSLYAGRPAFDTVIQAMSGVMDLIRSDGMPLKTGPSSADIMGGELAVVSILAALEHRDRTGEGQSIDLSMQDIAAWLTQTRWNGVCAGGQGVLLECSDGWLYAEAGASARQPSATDSRCATRAELQKALTAVGVRSAPVNTVPELVAHPMTAARRLWFEFREADGETWPLLGSPLRLLETPPRVCHPMGPLDRDRDAVLKEWIGFVGSGTN